MKKLSEAIKGLTGVLEVGIFSGLDGVEKEGVKGEAVKWVRGGQRPVAVYFGNKDGSVEVRTAKRG